ncbi:unnamed protein product [Closterium sp. Naga37s-1]|nr:unnamed protein product [Closterium sp. Naga37s-1]
MLTPRPFPPVSSFFPSSSRTQSFSSHVLRRVSNRVRNRIAACQHVADVADMADMAGNTDHRGTPEKPGRTVTLVEEQDSVTYGVAYRLAGQEHEQREILQYLRHREKEYDQQVNIDFHTEPSGAHPPVIQVLVFIASDNPVSNPYYLGPAPLEAMAWQIATARGPSGPNAEYLLNLQKALSDLGACDPHVDALAALLSTMLPHTTTTIAPATATTTATAAVAATTIPTLTYSSSSSGSGSAAGCAAVPPCVHHHAHTREATGAADDQPWTCSHVQTQGQGHAAAVGLVVDAAVACMVGNEALGLQMRVNPQAVRSP